MLGRIRWRFALRIVAVILLIYITIVLIGEYSDRSNQSSVLTAADDDIRVKQQPSIVSIIGNRLRTLQDNKDEAVVNAKASNKVDSPLVGDNNDQQPLIVELKTTVIASSVKENSLLTTTSISSSSEIRNRIIHIDLKGAPPKVDYFKQIFELIARRFGATGILIEWEDMFPYEGELAVARNRNAYSVADVKQILEWARELSIDIIPLVQTFGHLEWILKYEQFAKYRQDERYPQVSTTHLMSITPLF
jgi:hypothetical protein